MNKLLLSIILIGVLSLGLVPNIVYAPFPPPPATSNYISKITTSNGTVGGRQLNSTLNVVGVGGLVATESNNSKTLYLTGSGAGSAAPKVSINGNNRSSFINVANTTNYSNAAPKVAINGNNRTTFTSVVNATSISGTLGNDLLANNFQIGGLAVPDTGNETARMNTIGNQALSPFGIPTDGQVLTFQNSNSTAIWKSPVVSAATLGSNITSTATTPLYIYKNNTGSGMKFRAIVLGSGLTGSSNGTTIRINSTATTTSINGTSGSLTLIEHNNATVASLSGTTFIVNAKQNILLTNGSTQTITKAVKFSSGSKLTLSPSATTAGIQIGTIAGDPSSASQGEMWYNSNLNCFGTYFSSDGTPTYMPSFDNNGITCASNAANWYFPDSTFGIENTSTISKKLFFSLSGSTSGKSLTIAIAQTNTETLNIPNIGSTDTLATTGLGQTFSGANTFSGSNTFSASQKATSTFDFGSGNGKSTNDTFATYGPSLRDKTDNFAVQLLNLVNNNHNRTASFPLLDQNDTFIFAGVKNNFTNTNQVTGQFNFNNATLVQTGNGHGISVKSQTQLGNATVIYPRLGGTGVFYYSFIGAYNATKGQLSGNGTGTSSTTNPVMDGVYATFTPHLPDNATVTVQGMAADSTLSDGCRIDVRTSTSSLGANGAGATGTVIGIPIKTNSGVANEIIPFSITVTAMNLSTTKNYFDVSQEALTGGTCTLTNVYWNIQEN